MHHDYLMFCAFVFFCLSQGWFHIPEEGRKEAGLSRMRNKPSQSFWDSPKPHVDLDWVWRSILWCVAVTLVTSLQLPPPWSQMLRQRLIAASEQVTHHWHLQDAIFNSSTRLPTQDIFIDLPFVGCWVLFLFYFYFFARMEICAVLKYFFWTSCILQRWYNSNIFQVALQSF